MRHWRVLIFLVASAAARAQKVDVVIDPSASELERYAASELCGYLEKLYGVRTRPAAAISRDSKSVLLVGNLAASPLIERLAGRRPLPALGPQGILLRNVEVSGRPGLIVAGGSPAATLWAVYELAGRWGVQYLVGGDVLPRSRGTLRVLGFDTVMEPKLTVRAHPTIQDFASSGESWGIRDFRRLIDQLAKLKFNRLNIYTFGWQPFLDYQLKGIHRRTAWLWYDYHYPITPDMPGRAAFGNEPEFWNPDLPFGAPYREFAAAGERLVHELIEHAHRRGMVCAVSSPTTDFTHEFAPLLKGAEKSAIRTGLTIVPGAATPVDDPQLAELARTTLRATINTYPEADIVTVWMPEVRQWVGEYRRAWEALDAKYGIGKVRSLEDVLSAAEHRKGWRLGGQRAVEDLKGDITSLYFYDRLLRENDPLQSTKRPDMKFMYWGVAEELFPIAGRVLPKGWQVGVMLENQPEQLLERAEVLRALPSQDIPSVLDLTIDDDNIGMVPQLTTATLHALMRHLVRDGWSGFVARERFPFDHDSALAYLARAAWEPDVDPETVARAQFRAICGEGCVADMLSAIREVESATVFLGDKNRNYSKERPDTITKYWQAGPVPAYLADVRARYVKALEAAGRARAKSTPEGRPYIDFWAGRLKFSIGFTDMVTAVYQAATAAAEGRRTEAAARTDAAIAGLRGGLDAYAGIVRSQSDRGAIAMLDEFGYRFLKSKRAEMEK